MTNRIEELEQVLKERGVLRVGDLVPLGFPKSYLSELEKRGRAIKQARGVYIHPDADIPLHYGLAIACQKVPGGVICLMSALAYHEIGTQNPYEVWMAIDGKAKLPKVDYPPLRTVRFSGAALHEGVEKVEGAFPIRVYSVAKTVADCFKYRRRGSCRYIYNFSFCAGFPINGKRHVKCLRLYAFLLSRRCRILQSMTSTKTEEPLMINLDLL